MADQGMPTSYDTQHTSQSTTIGFHKEYIFSLPGIFKIAEIVLSLITFICSVADYWYPPAGSSWVSFVSLTAFFSTLITFIFYVIGLYYRFPAFRTLIEFVYYCVFTGLYIIAALVAAAQASRSSAAVGAAAFFAFAATAVYAVDTFFKFRAWRSGQSEMSTHTTTTTTHNPEAAKTTY